MGEGLLRTAVLGWSRGRDIWEPQASSLTRPPCFTQLHLIWAAPGARPRFMSDPDSLACILLAVMWSLWPGQSVPEWHQVGTASGFLVSPPVNTFPCLLVA